VTESNGYLFLSWNLFLSWLPLLSAWLLTRSLINKPWTARLPLLFTFFWLAFLPNSFYLISDFVHLEPSKAISLMYDVILLFSFAFSGLVLGWTSVFFVHRQLIRHLPARFVWLSLGFVFLMSSFAVYLGRFLGWNSWDIIFNPADILFDVSDRVLNPALYLNTFLTTTLFFVFISASYATMYWLVRLLSQYK
jgi:uncharacterized membrane protein